MTLSARNWAWNVNKIHVDGAWRPLKPGEKLTLLALAESENAEEGYAFPSHQYIADRTCQSVRTVQTHLHTFEDSGAIRISKRRSKKGRWYRNIYELSVPAEYRAKDPEWIVYQDDPT
jgi:hypothetical protein